MQGLIEAPEVRQASAAPNLFDLMPYRRTRGAVPAWLLTWADPSFAVVYRGLHECGRRFADFLLSAGGREPSEPDSSVTVHRHLDGADAVAELGDGTAIVLVERVERQERFHRLDAMRARLSDRYGSENLCPVFIELGNQPNHAAAHAAGFQVVERRALLSHARDWFSPGFRSAVLVEYYDHMQSIEQATHEWRIRRADAWCDRGWQGFLSALSGHLEHASWGRLDRVEGRPWGMRWNWRHRPDAPVSYFLRTEGDDLCFRLCMQRYDFAALSEGRDAWREALMASARSAGLELTEPDRPGWRISETVCVLPDFRRFDADGVLDFEATLEIVRTADAVYEEACTALGAVSTGGRP